MPDSQAMSVKKIKQLLYDLINKFITCETEPRPQDIDIVKNKKIYLSVIDNQTSGYLWNS
jgi:hypothetical protein